MRIYLIGFIGSGKTFLGKELADNLKFQFIDLDKLLEKKKNKSISEIFELHGEWYFRQKEADCLRETLQSEKAVIATGGGTPCFHENMSWINKNGISFYLKLPIDILYNRLLPIKDNRPLLAHLQDDELQKFIEKKLKERERFYLQAHHTIENPDTKKIINLL